MEIVFSSIHWFFKDYQTQTINYFVTNTNINDSPAVPYANIGPKANAKFLNTFSLFPAFTWSCSELIRCFFH